MKKHLILVLGLAALAVMPTTVRTQEAGYPVEVIPPEKVRLRSRMATRRRGKKSKSW